MGIALQLAGGPQAAGWESAMFSPGQHDCVSDRMGMGQGVLPSWLSSQICHQAIGRQFQHRPGVRSTNKGELLRR
ncbi:MAG: hypothetical protein ACK5RA_07410 [Cyanobacteriota bacterium]